MEGQNSIFVKVTFELRAEWQENRSLDNIRGETVFQAEAIASTNVLGAGEELGTLEEMEEEQQSIRWGRKGCEVRDEKLDHGSQRVSLGAMR